MADWSSHRCRGDEQVRELHASLLVRALKLLASKWADLLQAMRFPTWGRPLLGTDLEVDLRRRSPCRHLFHLGTRTRHVPIRPDSSALAAPVSGGLLSEGWQVSKLELVPASSSLDSLGVHWSQESQSPSQSRPCQ